MIPFYTSLYNMALRLIKKYGMIATIKIPTAGNPVVSGQVWKPTANTFTTKNVNMVFLPMVQVSFYSQYFSIVEKEPYVIGFEYFLLANEGLKPNLNMIVDRSGHQQAIRYVMEYAPAGTALLYIVGLKE